MKHSDNSWPHFQRSILAKIHREFTINTAYEPIPKIVASRMDQHTQINTVHMQL